jgi:replication factor C large subunit
MLPWTKKYCPATAKGVAGQDSAMQRLRDFVVNFKKQKKKALLIYGPSGTGKSCAVHAVANDNGYEIIEVNASDERNNEQILNVVGNALRQQSLFSKGKVILIDELDGISGRDDRGGVQALAKLLEKPAFPVVMAANNPWDQKFSSLRGKAELVQFHSLNYLTVFGILKRICETEKLKIGDNILKSLARQTSGDLRAAINDLQSLTQQKRDLTEQDLEELSQRDQIESIMQALLKIFKTTQAGVAIRALDGVEEDLDTTFLWIDENLPKEYGKPQDLYRAYEALAKADAFRGRIKRWQHWRFLVYVSDLMTAGVALGKDEKYHNFAKYGPTTRILKIWQANMKYQKRKAIAAKIAEQTHASVKEVVKCTMPYLQVIFRNSKKAADEISHELNLDREEVEWLRR